MIKEGIHENAPPNYSHLGTHIVAEYFEGDFEALNDGPGVEQALRAAAEAAGAPLLRSHSHRFEPHGVSAVAILRPASNLCVHTWPEHGYAAADFFTSGGQDPWLAFNALKAFFKSAKTQCVEIKRGDKALISAEAQGSAELQHQHQQCSKTEHCAENLRVVEVEPSSDMEIAISGRKVMERQSQFQKVSIVDNGWWGKVLWLDDNLNLTERDEFIYHEMLVHVPMLTHPRPRRVLIVGGGDGGSAREVLKHPDLERVVMIDIDGEVVEACRKHLPSLNNGAFDDARLELLIGDGIEYVSKAASNSFDVIIVDSTDPIDDSPGTVLFSSDFYSNVHRVLDTDGVVSTQSLRPMRDSERVYKRTVDNLRAGFTKDMSYLYLLPIDSYLGTQTFGLGFKGRSHPEILDKARVKAFCKANKLKYYSHGIHLAAFCLPAYLKDILGVTYE